jgi:hypothetical protein
LAESIKASDPKALAAWNKEHLGIFFEGFCLYFVNGKIK